MTQRTVAIVQARMGSTRLPGKVLRNLQGVPVLGRIVERLSHVKGISEIVLATSDQCGDTPIADYGKAHGLTVCRGSETDVLDRFYQAAVLAQADVVLRAKAECPLLDPALVSRLRKEFASGTYDTHALACGPSNDIQGFHPGRFPAGLDAEVISMEALTEAWIEAKAASHREDVTAYVRAQPRRFRVGSLHSEQDTSDVRLSLETEADLKLLDWIYQELAPSSPIFGLPQVLQLLAMHPEKTSTFASMAPPATSGEFVFSPTTSSRKRPSERPSERAKKTRSVRGRTGT
jgi:spore coat polysaccharide biosynthesis protein SpsF (cytidylyltransferase family)